MRQRQSGAPLAALDSNARASVRDAARSPPQQAADRPPDKPSALCQLLAPSWVAAIAQPNLSRCSKRRYSPTRNASAAKLALRPWHIGISLADYRTTMAYLTLASLWLHAALIRAQMLAV